MSESKKVQNMRADFINFIKSVVFMKGKLNICGEQEINFDDLSNVIFLDYFDINGASHSSYIESVLLCNDKLVFDTKNGDVLTPSDLEMKVLKNIVDILKNS
nr:MAG: hypothetical protein [Bacteriophage sp.]